MRLIVQLAEIGRRDAAEVGGKGANLGELIGAGLPVPDGFVLTTAASPRDAGYAAAPLTAEVGAAVLAAYARLGDDVAVAVRSSATTEDLADASFAGQQESYLNVRGGAAVLTAVQRCWASAWSERAVAYRQRQGVDPATVAMAVVVQRLVPAESAGVMFTANPTNGRRDEVVVSAAWGLGEAVVSGSVDPDQLVLSADGRVLSRSLGDKAVRTELVPTAEGRGTREAPLPAGLRGAAVLDDAAAAELVALGLTVQTHFGGPQDIEWARADGTFWILQARPITALPPAEAPPPTDWTVPDPPALYVRASIVEQLPDPLSPLFADLIDGSVSRSLTALMDELSGAGLVHPGDVGLPTVNGYAYYRYSRRGMLRLTLSSGRAFRMLFSGATLPRWRDEAHPRYRQAVARWVDRPLADLSRGALLDAVVELLDAGTSYYTAVQTVIPVAAGSESIFRLGYRLLFRRAADPPAEVFLVGFDSEPIRAEASLWDLAAWTREQPALMEALRTRPAAEVLSLARSQPDSGAESSWAEWHQRLQVHLARYGHAVYNLDFATPVPAEDPAPLLSTLRFYLDGGGVDPRGRQQRSTDRREAATATLLARLGPVRRRICSALLRWAQSAAPLREDALADIGLAWPQLRRLLRELGARLVAAGVIEDAADVCWLTGTEILDSDGPRSTEVEHRKQLWRGRRRVTPPQLLPAGGPLRWLSRLMPAGAEDQTGAVIHGTGASAGVVTATARVLRGPADFAALQPGEVLVAVITTPAWTPLFALAGAVVTDVGGPLSHSSIVAREYGVPAVLGTAVATRRIRDGQRVRVDGTAGTVTLLTEASES